MEKDNEKRPCSRCGARARRPQQSWCTACFREYQRERTAAKAAGNWNPVPGNPGVYPTDADRLTARQWRRKVAVIRMTERRLEEMREEAAALRLSFKRRDGK